MAAFDTTRVQFETVGIAGRIGRSFAGIVASFSTWNEARVTRNALASLSDRELDDIGLSRNDIETLG
ncbi:Uncharacterized conserved protein YjiS, DUF1127 family [Shimia gijangensis]|uniref:Uncharacterized conserved protein YjiS, DUF1127 family n=1 Tax=Shimia gijangensis TaxID=1470563 RepID=A0A1M6IEB9_9RHOB|nr:DUF1127 domain-containing protein [Shimia gijangensis]SHJ32798.1 Uncharacterized conserved protein YjiS, DUF1127 family [Shimia gijangensis]